MAMSYDETYARSLADPEGFWAAAAADLHWDKKWDTVLDRSHPPFYRWFVGGELNTCYNCLDRHVAAGRGAQTALIYDSPVTGKVRKFTYAELTDKVARFAGALAARGVTKGDRVLIYMPMVPQAAVAMLACARLGAVLVRTVGHGAGGRAPRKCARSALRALLPGTSRCGFHTAHMLVPHRPVADDGPPLGPKLADTA